MTAEMWEGHVLVFPINVKMTVRNQRFVNTPGSAYKRGQSLKKYVTTSLLCQ